MSAPVSHKKRTFWEHAGSLRNHIVVGGLFFVVAIFGFFSFATDIAVSYLLLPLNGEKLVFLSPLGPFMFKMRVALWLALAVSVPLWLGLVAHFVGETLSIKQRAIALVCALLSVVLGVGSMVLSYLYLIPLTLRFLMAIVVPGTMLTITADSYLTFFLLILSVAFVIGELPLLLVFFTSIGLLDPHFLIKRRRMMYLVLTIVLAFLTPTTDLMTLGMVLVPTVVLTELGLFVSVIVHKGSVRKIE